MVELCVLSVLAMHHCVCEDFKCVGRGRVQQMAEFTRKEVIFES